MLFIDVDVDVDANVRADIEEDGRRLGIPSWFGILNFNYSCRFFFSLFESTEDRLAKEARMGYGRKTKSRARQTG